MAGRDRGRACDHRAGEIPLPVVIFVDMYSFIYIYIVIFIDLYRCICMSI